MTPLPRLEDPVRTAAELTDRWAGLLDPPVFRRRELWLGWLDAGGLMLPTIVPVEDVPLVPDGRLLAGIVGLHDTVTSGRLPRGSHLALALCRPGGAAMREDDALWTDALHGVLDDRIDGSWSLHLAAGGAVTPLVPPPWGP